MKVESLQLWYRSAFSSCLACRCLFHFSSRAARRQSRLFRTTINHKARRHHPRPLHLFRSAVSLHPDRRGASNGEGNTQAAKESSRLRARPTVGNNERRRPRLGWREQGRTDVVRRVKARATCWRGEHWMWLRKSTHTSPPRGASLSNRGS